MGKWLNTYYSDNYSVSDTGLVMNNKTGRVLKPHIGKPGYRVVRLYKNPGISKKLKISKLVGMAFISNPYNKPILNHKDLDKTNDDMNNLEWVTYSENTRHWRGLHKAFKKSGKTVYSYNIFGGYLAKFNSIKSAADNYHLHPNTVRDCCNRKIIIKPKIIFTYIKGQLPTGLIPKSQYKRNHFKMQVKQFSKTGVLLETFSSTKLASKSSGASSSAITKCCKGKRESAGGFHWSRG